MIEIELSINDLEEMINRIKKEIKRQGRHINKNYCMVFRFDKLGFKQE